MLLFKWMTLRVQSLLSSWVMPGTVPTCSVLAKQLVFQHDLSSPIGFEIVLHRNQHSFGPKQGFVYNLWLSLVLVELKGVQDERCCNTTTLIFVFKTQQHVSCCRHIPINACHIPINRVNIPIIAGNILANACHIPIKSFVGIF